MGYKKFEKDAVIIQRLDNRPNAVDGLSGDQLKERFDQIGILLKEYLNGVHNVAGRTDEDGLIDQLDAGAANMPIQAITGLDADTVQEALEALLDLISSLSPDPPSAHSIGSDRLSRKTDSGGAAVGTDNIAAGAVTNTELASDENSGTAAVGEHNIKPLAVKTRHIDTGAVTGGAGNKIAQSTISKWNMGTDSVGTDQLENGCVTGNKISSESPVPYAKTSGVQKQAEVVQQGSTGWVTVPSSGWDSTTKRQTVTGVSGVTATNHIVLGPWVDANYQTPSSVTNNWTRIRDYGIRCIGQGDGTLTFECETVPSTSDFVGVWFVGVSFS